MTVVGAQYYRPPNPPREDWARDLRMMRDAGMNTVKFWACWSWINGTEGQFDFADLDELMDLARANDLDVVINTIIENAPYWLETGHPNARYVDQEGHALHLTAAMNTPGGGWPGLCFDNDAAWERAAEFLRVLVQRYDGHPALMVWDVWNEPHLEPASYFPDRMYCYCDASIARFVAWLRAKYGTLDALNLAWSRRFSSWDQVAPPRVFEAVPDLIDWRSFWFDNLRRWLERRARVVREASDDTPVMTHVALSGFTGQLATHTLDEFTLTGDIDVFGTSSFPTWLMADDHVEHLLNLDTARDAAEGKPFWQAELQGGRGRRAGAESTGQPRPEVVRLWMWNALAAGATGVMFWQWRPELLGPESPGYGLTTPGGGSTARLDAAAEMAEVARLPELAGRTTISGPVGLVVSRLTALHAFATDRSMAIYRDAVMGAYRLLLDAGAPPALVHEDQITARGVPTGVSTLYWPMPAVASDELLAALASFVESGGTLVAEASPGEYDQLGHRRTTVPGAGLEGAFGAVESETDTGTDIAARVGDHMLRGAWQVSRLDVGEAAVRAVFATGGPAVVEHDFGGGRTVLIATYPSVDYHRTRDAGSRAAIAGLLAIEEASTARWDEPAPGLLIRRALSEEGREMVFALNWTAHEASLRLGIPVTVLAPAGKAGELVDIGDAVTIPGMSGSLLIGRG